MLETARFNGLSKAVQVDFFETCLETETSDEDRNPSASWSFITIEYCN